MGAWAGAGVGRAAYICFREAWTTLYATDNRPHAMLIDTQTISEKRARVSVYSNIVMM